MKHKVIFAVVALGLAIAACGGGSKGPDLAATQAALEATQQALANSSNPTQESQPTEGSTDAEAFYVEEWEFAPDTWSYFLMSGDEADLDLYTEDGRLVFDIGGENVWAYYTYDAFTYTDVRLDATAENLGNNNNNVSFICRYNDRGWYEFNVANNGLYNIYRYDSADDTYRELRSGGVQNLKVGKDTNDFTIICEGDRLTLGVNGVEIWTVEDSRYDEGLVGISVSSFTGTPVLVEFDYVEISQP